MWSDVTEYGIREFRMLKVLNSELNDILNIDSAIGINDHCHRISHTKIQNTNTSDINGQLLVRFRPNGLSPSDKKTKTVITVSRSILFILILFALFLFLLFRFPPAIRFAVTVAVGRFRSMRSVMVISNVLMRSMVWMGVIAVEPPRCVPFRLRRPRRPPLSNDRLFRGVFSGILGRIGRGVLARFIRGVLGRLFRGI